MAERRKNTSNEISLLEFATIRRPNEYLYTTERETQALNEAGVLPKVVSVIEADYPEGVTVDPDSVRAGFQLRKVVSPENGSGLTDATVDTMLVVTYNTGSGEQSGEGFFQLPVTAPGGKKRRYVLGGADWKGPSIHLTDAQSELVGAMSKQKIRPTVVFPRVGPMR